MKKIIAFNTNETITVENETFNAISFGISSLTSAPAQAAIADLSKISINILLHRKNKSGTIVLVQTFFDKLLVANNGNSALNGYFTGSDTSTRYFKYNLGGSLHLAAGDRLEIQINAQSAAFTSHGSGNISVETVPSFGASPTLNQLEVFPIGNSEVTFDKNLKSGIFQIIHFANKIEGDDFQTSTKAKITDLQLESNGFNKNVTGDVIWQENLAFASFASVPIDEIYNMILYASQSLLQNVRLRLKLDTAADSAASILVLRKVQVL